MTKTKRKLNSKASPIQVFMRKLHGSRDLRRGLAGARCIVDPKFYPTIVRTLGRQAIYKGLFAQISFPNTLSKYTSKKRLEKISTRGELLWTASVLSIFTIEISEYVLLRDSFYKSYFNGDIEVAMDFLNRIQEKFGYSLWLIGHKLQLLQSTEGLQAQKEFLEEIVSTGGLNQFVTFISYYLSLRAESSISYESFYNQISPNLAIPELSDYIICKLIPHEISNIADPGNITSWDENHCIIDRYESFVTSAVVYFSRGGSVVKEDIILGLSLFQDINDQIVNNVLCVARGAYDTKYNGLISNADLYTEGKYDSLLQSNGIGLELEARAYALLNASPLDGNSIKSRTVSLLHKIITIAVDSDESREQLKKIALIFSGHACSYEISGFLERKHDHLFVDSYSEIDRITAITSPLDNPWHAKIISELSGLDWSECLEKNDSGSPSLLLRRTLNEKPYSIEAVDGLENVPTYRRELYKGHIALKNNEYDLAISYYNSVTRHSNPYIAITAHRYLFNAFLVKKDYRSSMYLVIDHAIQNPTAAKTYPLEKLSKICADDESLYDDIGLALLLSISSRNGYQKLESDISDVYENILEKYDCSVPSELTILEGRVDIKYLIYFLRYVCVPRIMDDTTCFESLDQIDSERIKVCQYLLQIDDANKPVYLSEIRTITRDKNVAKLLKKVQTSKIYVDEEGVRQAIEPFLKGAFSRYKELLDSPELAYQAEKLSKMLGDMLSEKGHPEFKDLKLPATERESLFTSMLEEAVLHFALNPAYGLDTHLSTSIRHGAFEGHLRSPLAIEDLLCPVVSGAHVLPEALKEQLSCLSDIEQNNILKSLVKFTQKFDQLITSYLEDKIQIQTPEISEGMFSFVASVEKNKSLLESMTPSTEYEVLVDNLIEHCWSLTTVSLSRIRESLLGVSSDFMIQAFDQLVKGIETNVSHEEIAPLLDSIARARTGFQSAIQDVAEWFQKPTDLTREPFELESAIHVALQQINNCYGTTALNYNLKSNATIKLDGKLLDGFCEVLFILLQNVIIHGGFNDQTVDVSLFYEFRNDELYFEIANQISDAVALEERRAIAIEAMRLYQRDTALRMARKEGGSGLSKIWRIAEFKLIVEHSIQLDVTESREFITKLSFKNLECLI